VVLSQVVPLEQVATLRQRMLADLETMRAPTDGFATQFTQGNIQQDPPPFPPYLFREVLSNEAVVEVSRAVLGDGIINTFYSGNTNLPSSAIQPVHFDTGHIWPGCAHPPHMLVVNLPLVDFTLANGATEIWPGSHLVADVGTPGSIRLRAEDLDEQRRRREPLQVEIKAGDMLIRDMRLWHRGMPNHTGEVRTMIAMIHVASWWRVDSPDAYPGKRMEFAVGSEPFLEHTQLKHYAHFVEPPVDYLFRHEAYDVDG
jgi:ectoine hydroxylase-related dioxygenase (phytanoyl-CoA dioxygenase family)